MNIHFITFGCKVNSYETAAMAEAFRSSGHTITRSKDDADIIIINSCTVTSESDNKLMQTMRKLKREYPRTPIALTGCFPQAFPSQAAEAQADIIAGTKDRLKIVRLAEEYFSNNKKNVEIAPLLPTDRFEPMSVKTVDGHTRAFVKIQDGCNCFCTYCIIPYSRGRIRSKSVSDIISETQQLAEAGYKEIVLVGINLAFYGNEIGLRLIDAVEAVCSVDGIERVRLGSLEPEKISDDDLIRLSAQSKFCPSFHLSLQSGCDRTLKAMNRHYTASEYAGLTERIRKTFPDCGITADVMVGFPGETEEDHIQSMELVERIGFSDIHVFPYSRRKGTKADLMEGQVEQSVKKRRAREMTEVGSKARENFLQSLIGKEFPVLFEREKADGVHHGYAPNYVNIKILTKYSERSLQKKIFYVRIDKIGKDCCFGEIIHK